MPGTLVAGIGNIFLGDDAFGVEVVRRLRAEALPQDVRVADFGIRSLHLAYELLDGRYDLTILIDLLPRGGTPGTLYVMEPDLDEVHAPPAADAHTMSPASIFSALRALGGTPGRVLIVGCEPASLEEGAPLSPHVEAAVETAASMVRDLLVHKRARGAA